MILQGLAGDDVLSGGLAADTLDGGAGRDAADEISIGTFNNKTTAVRIIPVPDKGPGETVEFGGLLGQAIVMPVSRYQPDGFIALGGRIPAPVISLRN